MVELKTQPNQASVEEFINSVKDDQVRQDCWTIVDMMQKATNAKPQMWGASIVGFGSYHYQYASGREADWMLTGLSPRKKNITIYLMTGFEQYGELLAQLGKYSLGKSCLYIKRLADINLPTLTKLIAASVQQMNRFSSPTDQP